jgi:hypothetical protein
MDMPLYKLSLTLIICRKDYNPAALLLLTNHRKYDFLSSFIECQARLIEKENRWLMQCSEG